MKFKEKQISEQQVWLWNKYDLFKVIDTGSAQLCVIYLLILEREENWSNWIKPLKPQGDQLWETQHT